MQTDNQQNVITLNVANKQDQEEVYDFLGGKKFTEESMPYLHELIQKQAGGQQGNHKIRTAGGSAGNGKAASDMRLQVVYDETNKRLLIHAAAMIDHPMQFGLSKIDLVGQQEKTLSRQVDFSDSMVWNEQYVDMEPEEMESLQCVRAMFLWKDESVQSKICECSACNILKINARVRRVDIVAPVKQSTTQKNEIIISFARKSQISEGIDYDLEKFKAQNNIQPVSIPIFWRVYLEHGRLKEIDYENSYMYLVGSKGQRIQNINLSKNLTVFKVLLFQECIVSTSDGNWGQGLTLTGSLNSEKYKLVASIVFKTTEGETGLVQVNSADVPRPYAGGYSHDIPVIKLYWGCLGKDSLVEKENGETCTIAKLQIGDVIKCGKNGKKGVVRDIITGQEDEIWSLETEDDRRILLTKEHPVWCKRGWSAVQDLCGDDEVYSVRDGSYSKIRYLYPLEYHDMVYNLSISYEGDEIGFQADDFLVGDLKMQNTVEKEMEEEHKSMELPDAVKEQLKRFVSGPTSEDQG